MKLIDESDPEGLETLSVISEADRFNKWMYQTISPYCQGKILEIGSGIGNISRQFLDHRAAITLSDVRGSYCAELQRHFPDIPVRQIDLVDPAFEQKHSDLLLQFDTVFALNVVEHIEQDSLAIRNCNKLLKPGGRIVILVPAYQSLYNSFDRALGHFRRYTRQKLNALLTEQQFSIVHSQYFNCAGILGWFVSGSILRNKTIPKKQMGLYNTLVGPFKLVDACTFRKIGLSVISVGTKAR